MKAKQLFKPLKYLLSENFSNQQLISFSRSLTSFQTPQSHLKIQSTKKRSFSLKNDKLSISQEEVKRLV